MLIRGYGIHESARVALHPRFHPDDDDSKGQAMIENPWFRGLVFISGALPQTVKVLSLRGVPWSQVLCVAYLLDFLVTEILTIVAGKERNMSDHDTQHPPTDTETTYFFQVVGGCPYFIVDLLR